jgi:hypothetical protein
MSNPVIVNLTTLDKSATKQEFGTPGLFTKSQAFANRTKEYFEESEVATDFTTLSKEYFAAQAVFAQNPRPVSMKILRMDVGDATIADAVNAIENEDAGTYDIFTTLRAKQDILDLAAAYEGGKKIFFACSEDVDVYDSAATTDVLSTLAGLNYNGTNYTYHHDSGVDSVSASAVVASEIVTVTETGHRLRAGDRLVVTNHADGFVNGLQNVASVIDADNFTFEAVGAGDSIADPIDYFARYTFFEGALIGLTAPEKVGAITYKFKTPVGQQATPRTLVNSSELQAVLNKGGNIFITDDGLDYFQDGWMVSGRFIDIMRGMDWLESEMKAAVKTLLANAKKIPYTNDGFTLIEAVITDILDAGLDAGVLAPLSDTQLYDFEMPNAFDILTSDRGARKIPDIPFTARIENAVHSVVINGILLI